MLQLKSLRLKNWFNFKDTTIEFGEGPHCLVGVNGIGKTNIGKAFYMVKQMSLQYRGIEQIIQKYGGFKSIKNAIENNKEPVLLVFEILINNDVCIYTIEIRNGDYNPILIESIEFRKNKDIEFERIAYVNDKGYNGEMYFNGKLSDKSSWNASILDRKNENVIVDNVINFFKDLAILLPVDLSLNSIVRSEQQLSYQKTYLLEDLSNFTPLILEWKKEFKSTYKLLLKELQRIKHTYSAFEAMPTNTNVVSMYVAEDGLERDTYIGNLSEGTLKYILLLLIILNPNKPSFIFMDEPDTHLHPDMISNLFRLLNEIGTQSLITTHNPLFVDRFEREQILYLTFNEEEGTKVNKAADIYLAEEEKELLTPYELFSRGFLS